MSKIKVESTSQITVQRALKKSIVTNNYIIQTLLHIVISTIKEKGTSQQQEVLVVAPDLDSRLKEVFSG